MTPYSFDLFQSMPPEWESWRQKICGLLGIEATVRLESQGLPQPWFLIPTTTELTEKQAAELATVVRHYLADEGKFRVSTVRDRLLRLSPDQSLVFLYLSRYIAFTRAGSAVFWPPFREELFQNKLSYDEVAVRLASTTSTLWIRLYRHTNGALFYPRQGPRHIRWPLAHAGLLAEDKEVLKAYGLAMLAAGGDMYRQAVSEDTEEFILQFRDWANETPEYRLSRFGQLLFSKLQERNIIAELGQQWLRIYHDDLETQAQASLHPPTAAHVVRRRLAYDARSNELSISLTVGSIRGCLEMTFEWDGREIPIRTQYISARDETNPYPLFLALSRSSWSDSGILRMKGREDKTVDLPDLAGKNSAVFNVLSGHQTQQWAFGEQYYILLPGASIKTGFAERLFTHWENLGPPKGDWNDWSLLWARTRSLFEEDAGDVDLETRLEQLEEAADAMNLPSFGHQLRYKTTLLGPRLSAESSSQLPAFHPSRPPYLEISGIWTSGLTVKLEQQTESSGNYREIASLSIDRKLEGGAVIVELWSRHAPLGRYRLVAGKEKEEFVVVQPWASQGGSGGFNLAIDFVDREGEKISHVSRYGLNDLQLLVSAWPYAELTMEIGSGQGAARYLSLQTEAEGSWSESVTNLPLDLSSFPSGDLSFAISWRGVRSARIAARDEGFVAAESVQCKMLSPPNRANPVISCTGSVRGLDAGDRLIAYLLDEVPWERDPLILPLLVREGDFYRLAEMDWVPSWLVIALAADNGEADQPILIKRLDHPGGLIKTQFELAELLAPDAQTWLSRASHLESLAHPPGLRPYLHLAPFLAFLHELPWIVKLAPHWLFVSEWGRLEEVQRWLEAGYAAALFRHTVRQTHRAQSRARIVFDLSQSRHERGESHLPFTFAAMPSKIAGLLVAQDEDGLLKLAAQQELRGCARCNLIMPARGFDGHRAPYEGVPDCTAIRPSFSLYGHGETPDPLVKLGVFVDPSLPFEELRALLQRIQTRDLLTPPPEQIAWLTTLGQHRPQEVAPDEWAGELLRVLDNVWEVIQQPVVSLETLAQLGVHLRGYQAPIRLILETVKARLPS